MVAESMVADVPRQATIKTEALDASSSKVIHIL